jgi:DNA-binding NarL/FixJ family response regulator
MKTRGDIKISIIDSNSLYREELVTNLTQTGYKTFYQGEDCETMLNLLVKSKPDVLIYDFFNSAERFYRTVEKIKTASKNTKVLVLSFENSLELINFCFDNGINGFCNKAINNFGFLAESIEKIACGETHVIARRVLKN